MSNLQSFPPNLKQSRKLQVNKMFQTQHQLPTIQNINLKSLKSIQFIPFIIQRDGIGKLIRNKTSTFQSPLTMSICFNQKQSNSQDKNKQILKQNKIKFQSFKKFDNLQSKQNTLEIRKKIRQKQLQNIQQQQQIKSNKQIIILQPFKEIKQINDDDFKFRKVKSVIFKKQQQKNSTIKKKTNTSQMTPIKMPKSISLLKQRQQQYPKTTRIPSLQRIKINSNDYPQLKRFKQMQKLSIKVINDFQDGHTKFLTKIRQTKMKAIKIKQDLQIN